MRCSKCGKALCSDDIGAFRKFVSKAEQNIECIACISSRLRVSEEQLREKIEFLRKHGCTLFL